ncbi:TIGR00341 family protein [Salinirarus marinus]|uniref:TIGR00341 family protein n=1 Tax=Salinirarus marinus TaxID=3068310 RepID=UPI003C6CA5ED
MRLVQVMVPTGKREALLRTLDDENIDYAVSDEVGSQEYTAVVWFPLPTEAVQPILERLYEAGFERDAFTVVVDAETVVSQRFDALEAEYERGSKQIAREELAATAQDLAPDWWPFVVMTAISAVVATAGLLLDSPAVVVGSMVIAPLVGPAMSTSVGTVVDDRALFLKGVKQQAVGGVLAIASAAAFAFLLRQAHVVPLDAAEVLAIDEVRERLVPDVLSLVIALGAGVAGAISLSSGVSTAIVGVMIAAALIPPTAVVGIGLAWGRPLSVVGALVLVLVNVLSINFAALGVLWYAGYRPRQWLRAESTRLATAKQIAVLGVAILLLSGLLGAVTFTSYQKATFEDRVRSTVADEVDDYPDLRLLGVEITYGDRFPITYPEEVVITLGYTPGTETPALADRLAERVDRAVSRSMRLGSPGSVAVEVRYVAYERSSAKRLQSPDRRPLSGDMSKAPLRVA